MSSENLLLDLIGRIYDAGLDASQWPAFLEGFSNSVDAGPTVLITHDMRTLRAVNGVMVRMDPHWQQLYIQHYGAQDRWREEWLKRFRRPGPEAVVTGEQLVSAADLIQEVPTYEQADLPNARDTTKVIGCTGNCLSPFIVD